MPNNKFITADKVPPVAEIIDALEEMLNAGTGEAVKLADGVYLGHCEWNDDEWIDADDAYWYAMQCFITTSPDGIHRLCTEHQLPPQDELQWQGFRFHSYFQYDVDFDEVRDVACSIRNWLLTGNFIVV